MLEKAEFKMHEEKLPFKQAGKKIVCILLKG